MSGCKAAIIDGSNFHRAHLSLGVPEINYQSLVHYVQGRIGTKLPVVHCKATIHPAFCDRRHQLFRDLTNAKFDVVPATSNNDEDDNQIKRWLDDSLQQPETEEIIIFSGDGVIVRHALDLVRVNFAKARLCRLYVIATLKPNAAGNPQIGHETLSAIKACSCARFLDLKTFLHLVALRSH